MDEDKKRKKNKKKKSKQPTQPAETVIGDASESTSDNQSNQSCVSGVVQDKDCQVSGNKDAPAIVDENKGIDTDSHFANGNESASFHVRIKELQAERDALMQKEAKFQEKIKELEAEREAQIHKEAILEEKIKQLLKEKDDILQREGLVQQEIKQLQIAMDALLQKEAILEMKILQLEREKDSSVQKEVSLQEKLKQMERERDSWILKESSAKESIASLNDDITKLRAQEVELEQSRKTLLEEKQQLAENISNSRIRINNLESTVGCAHSSMDSKVTSGEGDGNCQIEAAHALVDKLITENSDLVEKMNELYDGFDGRSGGREHVISVGSGPGAFPSQYTCISDKSGLTPESLDGAGDGYRTGVVSDSISEASKMISVSGSTQSLVDVILEDQMNGEHSIDNSDPGLANSLDAIKVHEIEQIQLGENEVQETSLEVAEIDENTEVPITDAPLIGAPFRLISFVARYVSGSDLVNKKTRRSGQ